MRIKLGEISVGKQLLKQCLLHAINNQAFVYNFLIIFQLENKTLIRFDERYLETKIFLILLSFDIVFILPNKSS